MRAVLYHFITHLALHLAAAAANECSNGYIRIMTNETVSMTSQAYYIAGGLQVCVNNKWTTVCHSNWGKPDATVACRQLGLSYINLCTQSCFGNIQINPSFQNFVCSGTESKLIQCRSRRNEGCGGAAGVYCALNKTSLSTLCGTTPESVTITASEGTATIATTTETSSYQLGSTCKDGTENVGNVSNKLMASHNQTATDNTAEEQQKVCNNTLEKALGTITALLGMALVCVIIFLVLTCLKLQNITSSSKNNKNLSMDNNAYGLPDIQPNGGQPTQPQESSSQNSLQMETNQNPAQHTMQSEPCDMEGDYHLITSEDNTVEDNQVYSVPYDENISRKVQKEATMDILSGPDQPHGDAVYSVLESEEYQMYSIVN